MASAASFPLPADHKWHVSGTQNTAGLPKQRCPRYHHITSRGTLPARARTTYTLCSCSQNPQAPEIRDAPSRDMVPGTRLPGNSRCCTGLKADAVPVLYRVQQVAGTPFPPAGSTLRPFLQTVKRT